MPVSIEQFTERINASGLLSQAEVQRFVESVGPKDRPTDVQQLVGLLVKHGKLTAYQARQIDAGRYRRPRLSGVQLPVKKGSNSCGLLTHQWQHQVTECGYMSCIDEMNLSGVEATMAGVREFASKPIVALSIPRKLCDTTTLLDSFPQLRFVWPPYEGTDEFMTAMRGNTSIRELHLYRTRVTDKGVAHLATVPNL